MMDDTLVACLFYAGAIILDAATAADQTDAADAPSSLRASSIITMLVLAAPLVTTKGYGGTLQRPVLVALLAIVALVGTHVGGKEVRCFDAIFVLVVLLGAIYLVCTGGVDEKSKAIKQKIDPVVACRLLTASLMAYGALRNLRASVTHASNVLHFEVGATISNATIFETAGYAVADESVTLFSSLAAATQLIVAILILVRDGELSGMPLRATAALGMFSSLTLILGIGSQADHLQAVFGDGACISTSSVCSRAAAARRFAIVNSPVASIFISSLATVVFARVATMSESPPATANTGTLLSWMAEMIFFVANLLSILFYCKLDGGNGVFIEYILLISIVALFVARKFDVWTGNAIFVAAAAFTLYELDAFHKNTFNTLPFIAFFVFFGLLCVHASLQLFLRLPYAIEACDFILSGIVALALAMALAATVAIACYSGAIVDALPFASGVRNAMLYLVVHYLPLFFAVTPGNRISPLRMRLQYRATASIASIVLVGVLHTAINWNVLDAQSASVEDWSIYASSIGAGLVPWLGVLVV